MICEPWQFAARGRINPVGVGIRCIELYIIYEQVNSWSLITSTLNQERSSELCYQLVLSVTGRHSLATRRAGHTTIGQFARAIILPMPSQRTLSRCSSIFE